MTIKAVLLATAALAALTGCAAAHAAPGQASQATAVRIARHVRPARCMKIDEYTFGPASQRAALRYWTPARLRSANGFSADELRSALELIRGNQAASGSDPAMLCVHVPVTSVDQTRATAPQLAKPSRG